MTTLLAENVAAIAGMSAQELRNLNVDEMAYVYDVTRSDSAIMRFGDTVLLIPQQELDVTCCRGCAFRMESAAPKDTGLWHPMASHCLPIPLPSASVRRFKNYQPVAPSLLFFDSHGAEVM